MAATGREHPGQAPGPTDATLRPIPHANDAQSLARYDETYRYDGANNLLEVVHRRAGQVIWRQRHQYAETSNRLLATGDAAEAAQPTYRDAADLAHSYAGVVDSEPRGAITAFPHVALAWDAEQRLRTATRGQVQRTYYRYDATGARLRKVTVDLLTQARRERIVLGRFELERRRAPGGSIVEDVEILHFFAGADRVATVEAQTVEAGETAPSTPRLRYVTSDHLGSSCLETGPTVAAPVLTYEEYRPYGSCAYRAARPELGLDPKRYRFCGKERDQETGLDYVGARYYAAWIGRWISPDPTGPAGGLNAYAYAGASPLRRVDPSGEADEDALPDPDQLREAVDQQMLALTDLKEQLDQVLPEAIRAWEDQSTLDRLNTLPELQKLLDLNKQIPALLQELQTLRNMYGDASVMGRVATRVHLATKDLFAHIIQFQLLVASLILDPIPTVVSLAAVEGARAAGVENPILLGLISLGASIATASAVVTVTSAMERAAATRSITSAARPLGKSAGAMAADDVARPTVYLDENIYYLEDAFKDAGWPVERVVAGTSDDAIRAALEPKIMEGSAVFVTQNFKDFRGMRLVRVGSGLPPDQQARITVDMVYYTTNYPGFWKQFVQAPASPLNKGHWRALFKTARGE